MLSQARDSFLQLPLQRRAILGAVVVGVVGALLLVARWASAPDYALLFGGLPAQDAGRVVEQLEGEGVAYELRDGGASVYVPRDAVYGLRLRLATEGVVSDGPAGYELFDGGTLGMTDFMQRLNVKRALEGELARTIGSVRQVERARVHLVLPERSPFRDQQVEPTASVVLSVRGTLGPDAVAGITALVAGAVEGLSPNGVTLLDEAGRMLAGPDMGDGDSNLSTAQLRMRREVEEHLALSGQSMLDRLLGPGRAVVRVAADLETARTVSEKSAVDPDSQTLISEETQEETGQGSGATSAVRNYELTRETTRQEREAGSIRSLTVSVLLDEAAPPVAGAGPRDDAEPAPFTEAQLAQVEALVKNAVGYDEGRGDRFAVQQLRFQSQAEPDGFLAALGQADAMEWAALGLRYGLILLVLFLGYRLLRRLADGLAEAAPLADVEGGPAAVAVDADGQLQGLDAPRTIASVDADPYAARLATDALDGEEDALDAVRAHVADHPEDAAAIVRAWLLEDA